MMFLRGPFLIVLLLTFASLPREAAAQESCPPLEEAPCVLSFTSLTYDQGTATMDAFTYAGADYGTAYWYRLCANLAILKLDGTPPSGWSTPFPSGVPICLANTTGLSLSGSAAATPGIDYVAVGSAMVEAVFEYGEVVINCYIYCTGYWDDEYAYSLLDVSQPPVSGPSRPMSATVSLYPLLAQAPTPVVKSDTKGSIERKSSPLPNLILSYDGNQISPGATAYIWNDAGTGAPRMPPVIASLSPNNFSEQVRWWVRFEYSGGDGVARSVSTPATSNPNVPAYKYTAASGTYNFYTDTNMVAGGTATLYWKVGNSPEQQAQINIVANNPARNFVKNLLGTTPWFLQKLAVSETYPVPCVDAGGMRQVYASCANAGRPIWGDPHGFGLMQIDPPPNYATLWDWTVNVTLGKQKLDSKLAVATQWWNDQVADYNRYKATHPTAKPPCDVTEGDLQQCRFGWQPGGNTHSFVDALWIKAYNSASPQFIAWSKNNYWRINRYNAGGFNYVNRVCSATVLDTP